jgi:type VI protein secretion system component VasK
VKPNDIYNEPINDQIKEAILQQIAEESQMVNKSMSEIKSRIQNICNSGLSKETKKRKITEIVLYIKNYSNSWIENSKVIENHLFK